MKGENTKLKFVNCEWFACRHTLPACRRLLFPLLREIGDVCTQATSYVIFKIFYPIFVILNYFFRENRWQVATEEKLYTEASGPSNKLISERS